MVVIGIDFGNDACVVSVWQNGRIEIVTNEFKYRYTPSMVAFHRKRLFGVSAKNQWTANAASTIVDLKNVLDVTLSRKWKFDLYNFTKDTRNSTVFFDVFKTEEKLSFSPCQILAMLFIKIKADAQAFMKTNEQILGCVISVPVHFTDQERKGVLMAAAIAKLDCHFLIKETTAVAINYSLYKRFPRPVSVIFIDFGHSSIQMSACKFFEKGLEVSEEVCALIGGRDIDEKLADHLMTVYKIHGANRNSKSFCAKLLLEVEQLKKKMSSSVQRHELLNFKQMLTGDPISMNRSEMEKICAPLFAKIETLMRLCLERSNLKIDEIHAVELVGGSNHLPIMKKLVEKVFNKTPLATMPRYESVARGCILKSLLHLKRRCYKIVDQPFDDEVDNFDGDFPGMKDLVRIYQVHRYLKCDRRDSFDITEKEFMRYVEMERKMLKSDIDEDKRRIARIDLDKYLLDHMQPGGALQNCCASITNELNETRAWENGTRDEYIDLLHYWTRKVEKLESRSVMRCLVGVDEEDAIDLDSGGTSHSDDQQPGSSSLVKRLTINEYDEMTVVDANTSTRTTTIQSGSALRFYRTSFPSRYRRLKRSTNLDAAYANNLEGLKNLEEDEVYRRNGLRKIWSWCCFM